jgi:pimeloyl-ACP methyl ester carboxylesterase
MRAAKARLVIDDRATLTINGSAQRVRTCSARTGLPPLLIVQAGPGLPVLHEVARFQRLLHLEDDFLVTYWDQRGCGAASRHDARGVCLQQQVDDLCTILTWFHHEARQPVIVFGISLGATIVLHAVAQEAGNARSVIAVSPDADTAASDAAVSAFLHEQGVVSNSSRLSGRVKKLGDPPYTQSAAFQLRARLLADLGGIERDKTFSGVLRATLLGMIGAYGPLGTAKALRNMSVIQDMLLPELVSLNLFANPPHVAVPVHYVFGEQDPLTPATIVTQLPSAIAARANTVTLVPNAGHMVHFDQPDVVRRVTVGALSAA